MNKRNELQALIKHMRSGDNEAALQAVETLRERGWLTDGRLSGADLREADFTDAISGSGKIMMPTRWHLSGSYGI